MPGVGPIVRISPDEVHINDPSFADTFFSSSSSVKLNKYDYHQHQFGMPESTFNTIDADLHKLRRSALSPFFSRRSINALEPILVEKVNKVCSRLQEWKENKTPMDLRLLFSCMTTDIITEYCFPSCFDLLSTPDLAPDWRNSFAEGLRNFQWFKHYPSLWNVLRSIPYTMLVMMAPQMAITANWERSNQKLVRDIVDTFDPKDKKETNVTIFHELLASELPQHEKSYERLWQEGSALIGAGVETTSNTLCVALYHLSQHPDMLAKLKAELEEAMPNAEALAPWAKLETLPYFSAVIKESLRRAFAFSSRLVRVPQRAPLKYGNYALPPGTAVSMSQMLLCYHPDIFDDPYDFNPERWLTKNGPSDMYTFGKGPRMCAAQK
jgi:cytochrome P450